MQGSVSNVSTIFQNKTLELVVYGGAGGFATADETGYFQVLGMIGIGAEIVPGVERTLQTDIEIRIGGVGDVDTHLLRAETGNQIQEMKKTFTDGTSVLYFSMTFGLV